jgi:signal transduction histidine kinase
MNIKARLTLQFGTITMAVLALALISIYLFSEAYREEEYYERLVNRSVNLAKLLIEVDEIDESLLYRIEEDNPVRLPEEAIQIHNFKNELIFNLDPDGIYQPDSALLRRIRLDSMITYHEGEREYLGLLFTSRYDRFVITASAVDVYGNRKVSNLRTILIIVFLVGALISFLTSRYFAYHAMRPVQRLVHEVEAISPADLSIRLEEAEGTDEIAQIADTFNRLIDRVEKAFKTQRNFIANASHEMRTPLTAITGQLEVLMLKERSKEEMADTVVSVIDDMHRLNRLANRLLLLAQTETDAAEANFVSCRIDEIIWLAAEDVQRLKPDYKVEVHFSEDISEEEQLTVHGSEVLLKSVVINLMENGCKYSDDHVVHVSLSSESGRVTFMAEDQGIGIPESELEHIFQPFYRGTNVGGRQGHGIGLSLVQRIVNLHQGNVEVHSTVGKGTQVKVSIPTIAI